MEEAHGDGTGRDIGEPKVHGSGSGNNRSWLGILNGRIRFRSHNVSQRKKFFFRSVQGPRLNLSVLLKPVFLLDTCTRRRSRSCKEGEFNIFQQKSIMQRQKSTTTWNH